MNLEIMKRSELFDHIRSQEATIKKMGEVIDSYNNNPSNIISYEQRQRRTEVLTEEQLVEKLKTIAKHVEAGDSFGGSFEYDCLECDIPNHYNVMYCYRVDNLAGQGSVMLSRGKEEGSQ